MASSQILCILFTVFNFIFHLHASYIGTPETTANLRVVLNGSTEFKCDYNDTKSGNFLSWYKDDVPISSDNSDHYAVKITEKTATLTVKIFGTDDAAIHNWYITTNNKGYEEPLACRFGPVKLKPSPQAIKTNQVHEIVDVNHQSIRRNQGESVRFICQILPAPDRKDLNNSIQWEFSIDGKTYADVPNNVVCNENELIIAVVQRVHRGYYRCSFDNETLPVLLRVKDRLAALWPFVGIVSTVLVFVVIILIFEKRRKAAKKLASTDDKTHDPATDPLVQVTTKTNYNESKKRAVDA